MESSSTKFNRNTHLLNIRQVIYRAVYVLCTNKAQFETKISMLLLLVHTKLASEKMKYLTFIVDLSLDIAW